MTILQQALIGAALAAAVGLGIFEARQNSRLQDQLQTLQQQQTFLTHQVRRLAEAHQETESPTAALGPPRSRPADHLNAGVSVPAFVSTESARIPSNQLENELLRALSQSTWGGRETAFDRIGKNIAPADLPRALAFLVRRPGLNGLETPLFDELASQWGKADPTAAIAWTGSLQDTNAQQRALTKVLLGWSQQHREEAASFAAGMLPGNLQDAAIKQVIGDWSFWDARGAARWLAQNPQFAEQTLGGLIFWGQGACPAAIADLLDQQYSLGHTNWLQQQGEQVASIWLSRDKAAAHAWIEREPFTDEVKQRLLNRDH